MSSVRSSDDEYDGTGEEQFATGLLEKMEANLRILKVDRRVLAKYAVAPAEAATRRLIVRTTNMAATFNKLRKSYIKLVKMYDPWSVLTPMTEPEIAENHGDFSNENFDTFCTEVEVLIDQVLEKFKLFADENPEVELDIDELRQHHGAMAAASATSGDDSNRRKRYVEAMIPKRKVEIGNRMTAMTEELAKEPITLPVSEGKERLSALHSLLEIDGDFSKLLREFHELSEDVDDEALRVNETWREDRLREVEAMRVQLAVKTEVVVPDTGTEM